MSATTCISTLIRMANDALGNAQREVSIEWGTDTVLKGAQELLAGGKVSVRC